MADTYRKAALIKNDTSCYKNTGSHSLNEEISPDHFVSPSLSTNVPQQQIAATQNEDKKYPSSNYFCFSESSTFSAPAVWIEVFPIPQRTESKRRKIHSSETQVYWKSCLRRN